MQDSSRQLLCRFENKSTTAHLYLACSLAAIAHEPLELQILYVTFYCMTVIRNKVMVRNVDVVSCNFNVAGICVNQNYMYKERGY
jgi:hypothetical protein